MIIPRQRPVSGVNIAGLVREHAIAGTFARGPAVAEFERRFARYTGSRFAIAFPSARTALLEILRRTACPESEVIVPSYTCPIVPWMIRAAGAVPVFVDSDPRRFTLSPIEVERGITQRTAAIIATHIEGAPCAMDEIMSLATGRKIAVIEDCAQALGAIVRGRKAGSSGIAGYFSFGSGKQLNTMGGGMAVTDNEDLAHGLRTAAAGFAPPATGGLLARSARQWMIDLCMQETLFPLTVWPVLRMGAALGRDVITMLFEEPQRPPAGIGSSPSAYSNIQAAIGSARLQDIDRENHRRRYLAGRLAAAIGPGIVSQDCPPGSVYTYFSIRTGDRTRARNMLLRQGIDTQAAWNRSCAGLEGFRTWRGDCPQAAALEREVLYLPLFPEMTDDQIDAVARACARVLS